MKLRLPLHSLKPRKTWIVLGVAIAMGLLAAGAARHYLSSQMAAIEARAQGETTAVVVAKTSLPAGTRLSAETVAVRAVPKEYAQSSALRPADLDRFQGRQLSQALGSGEMVLWSMLEGQKVPTFSARVPDGHRATTVAVDELSAISGLIEPGDRVDLLVTVDQKGSKYTLPLLQAVRVLATGQRSADEPVTGERRHYSTLTLDTTPQQAQELIVAREAGRLSAVLRHPADQRELRTSRADLTALLGLQGGEPPAPQAVRQVPVLYGGRSTRLPPEGLQMGRYVQSSQVPTPTPEPMYGVPPQATSTSPGSMPPANLTPPAPPTALALPPVTAPRP